MNPPSRAKNSILTDEDIPGIRHRIKTSQSTVPEEADRFGVGIETIRRAVRGETFRHVKDYLPGEPVLPADRAPHATRHPVPIPEDLAEEANESLRRVRESLGTPEEQKGAVEDFLTKRPPAKTGDQE